MKMQRRDFLKTAFCSAAVLSLGSCVENQNRASAKKPNIIFILTDDQGWADLASYGHPYVKTPNMDRLATEGTRFTQFYVNATVCAPSRVALMTGQFPAKHNVHQIYFHDKFNREHGVAPFLNASVPTVAGIMKSTGYHTGHIGKWHLCGKTPDTPDPSELGFDINRITHSEHVHPEFRERWESTKHPVTASSHWIMEDAIEFLENRKGSDKPFYLNLWTLVPHGPLVPTQEELSVYSQLKAKPEVFESWMKEYGEKARDFTDQMKIFCASLTSLDQAIGKLLTYLDNAGLTKDTIIIFTSDNGPEDYHVGDSANAGVGNPGVSRGRKRSVYEGGIKVPCIVRWPGKVPAGRVSSSVWTGVDLMPTLASITGANLRNPDELDGEDVSDIWFGAERQHRKEIFWEWKFEIFGNQDYNPPQLAIRDGNWKLLCDPDGTNVELYDISKDPAEKNNLAAEYPKQMRKLKEKLLAWKAAIPEQYEYTNE